ncbi:MAG: FliA/WhiG family RNA polymerase sigma factor [Deltaproteobacteria bacterium]|nr:FliA/WhiG family RNA polymerase sigma factor [Deltaproteobacteria bacterium]
MLTAKTPPAQAESVDRDELITRALPIVRRLAFRMIRRLPPSVDVGDLIGAGNEGLLKAARAYDPSRYPRFEPYAEARIRGAILDQLRSADQMTRHGRRRMAEVTKAMRNLTHELGHPPEEQQVADRLEMSLADYQKLTENLAHGPALGRLGQVDPDQVAGTWDDPASILSRAELKQELAGAIRKLPERTQKVLGLYYQEECTQAEIGEILGVTEGRVCQILGEAAARLRASMGVAEPKRRRAGRIGRNTRSRT